MVYEVKLISPYNEDGVNKVAKDFGLEDWEVDRIIENEKSILCAYHNGEPHFYEVDEWEPEDARFTRDLSWIAGALRKAYACGVIDGKSQRKQEG